VLTIGAPHWVIFLTIVIYAFSGPVVLVTRLVGRRRGRPAGVVAPTGLARRHP